MILDPRIWLQTNFASVGEVLGVPVNHIGISCQLTLSTRLTLDGELLSFKELFLSVESNCVLHYFVFYGSPFIQLTFVCNVSIGTELTLTCGMTCAFLFGQFLRLDFSCQSSRLVNNSRRTKYTGPSTSAKHFYVSTNPVDQAGQWPLLGDRDSICRNKNTLDKSWHRTNILHVDL